MTLNSKIRFFLLTLVFAILPASCENNKNDVIPDVYVDFTLNINDVQFSTLTSIGSSAIITSATNNFGSRAAGYDNNGIIVYRANFDGDYPEFYAYDRTCPHDFETNALSVKVSVDFTEAFCPQCSTRYALSSSGMPISGPGKYYLKNYKTYFSGFSVRVWNH